MNADDLPMPFPTSGKPMSFPEMQDALTEHFVLALGVDEGEAQIRSHVAVGTLINQHLVIWWGMTEDGLPLYVPRERVGVST